MPPPNVIGRKQAAYIDLPTFETIQEKLEASDETSNRRPLWAPNPCYLCSDYYTHIATGRDKADPSSPCPFCHGSKYGPQYEAYTTRAQEILLGGARGGGKSLSAISFLFKGNPHLQQFNEHGVPILVNQSYIHSPHYRGLIVRRNATDLSGFIEEAKKYFVYFGGHWVGGAESLFRFDSGAVIWTGHLDKSESYEKYLGMEIHRIVVEELTLIPDESLYLLMRTSLRSVHDDIHPQLLGTTNPIGRGMQWVKSRFVRVPRPDGSGNYPPRTLIKTKVKDPYSGKYITRTRIFIPALVRDNPYLMKNREYVAALVELPKKQRDALLHGSWDSISGAYFERFRNPLEISLPLAGEPENACHVITKPKSYPALDPWEPRAIGGDWGFSHETAYYWGCRRIEGEQFHVYRELVLSKTDPVHVGVEIAKRTMDDLNIIPSHKITLHLSPDAIYQKKSDHGGVTTFAQLIASGISQVLGAGAVYLPDLPDIDAEDIHNVRFRSGWAEFVMGLSQQKDMGVEIVPAFSNRILGWTYANSLLNWEPPPIPEGTFSHEKYDMLFREFGVAAAEHYKGSFSKSTLIYPRLQIWDTCPRLIAAIPAAQHDPKSEEDIEKTHFTGMDCLDAWRYLLMGLQQSPSEVPWEARRDRSVREYRSLHPNASMNDLVMFNRQLEAREAESAPTSYARLGRRATVKRRLLKENLSRLIQ
jgi:hypothetical protein